MSTSSIGSGSMLDVGAIVSGLMQIERQPVDKLTRRITDQITRISALGSLKSRVASLESAMSAFLDKAQFSAKSATVADSAAVSVELKDSARPADISLQVVSSAKSMRVAASGFGSDNEAVGSGTLKFSTGRYATSGDPATTSFAATGGAAPFELEVPAGTTLSGLRDLINNSAAPVQANLVQTGNGWSLVLNGRQTGADQALQIEVDNSAGGAGAGLAALAYSEASGANSSAQRIQNAQNAVIHVDGLRIERSSNTIDDVVPGVVFTLRKSVSHDSVADAPVNTVSITSKQADVQALSEKFISAYNDVQSTFKSLAKSGQEGGVRGLLNGDQALVAMMTRIAGMMSDGISAPVIGADGQATGSKSTVRFYELGIEIQRDGTVKLNKTALNNSLDNGLRERLAVGGASSEMADYLKSATSSSGLFSERQKSLQTYQRQLQDQVFKMENRLADVQLRYTKQYSSLDALLSRLNLVNGSLKSALDGLKANRKD